MKILRFNNFINESATQEKEFEYSTLTNELNIGLFKKINSMDDIKVGDDFIIGSNGSKFEIKDKNNRYQLFTVGEFRNDYIVPNLTYKIMPRTISYEYCWVLEKNK